MNKSIHFPSDVQKIIEDKMKETGLTFNGALSAIVRGDNSQQKKAPKPPKESKPTPAPTKQTKPVKQAESDSDFDRWFEKATPQQRAVYFSTGVRK